MVATERAEAPQNSVSFILLVAGMMSMSAMTIDINIPAIPVTAQDLGTTETRSQLTISLFFLGFALGQAFYGPISDRFGRKPVILAGISVFIFVSIACAFSQSIEFLLAMRVVQGLAAASGPVLGRAIVRDCFSGAAMARVMSYAMAAFILAPIIAPSIGAVILAFAGWRWIFVFLAAYAAIIWLVVFVHLQETVGQLDPAATRLSRIVRSYPRFFSQPVSSIYGTVTVLFLSALVIYLSTSSRVFMTGYGLTPGQFGLMFAVIAAFAAIASLVNARIAMSISLPRSVIAALFVTLAGLGLGLVAHIGGFADVPMMVLTFGMFFIGFNMIVANSTALAMQPHSHGVGSVASALGTFQSLVPAAISALLAPLQDGTVVPMILPMLALTLASLALALYGIRTLR